jgi:hypothetical protein
VELASYAELSFIVSDLLLSKKVMFPEILREDIWHTTSVERFEDMLAAGGILPEPPIPAM